MVSIPIITNRIPPGGSIVGVQDSLQFSARDRDDQVLRNTVNFYVGSGATFWEGGYLPEEHENISFQYRALSGSPGSFAARSIEPGGALKIAKVLANTNQEAMYAFGGLESPATLFDPLMVEFTLQLSVGDFTVDADYFTGVTVILKAGGSGVAIRFRYHPTFFHGITLYDANFGSAVQKGHLGFDWDQGVPHTYKLLWHPALDLVKLYHSQGQDVDTGDNLLLTRTVSEYAPLNPEESPDVQPVVLFGHGYPVMTSTSYWSNIYLYSDVRTPVLQGLYQGENQGFLLTDEVVQYEPTMLPDKAPRAWQRIPESFNPIHGVEELTTGGELILRRTDELKGSGFYRVEPKIVVAPCIMDFSVAGELLTRSSLGLSSTGMEVFIDDGTKQLRCALLNIAGVQGVGLLVDGVSPGVEVSYAVSLTNWVSFFSYRLILDSSGQCSLLRLEGTDEGVAEELVGSVDYSLLPASEFPGPGFGFLHNANVVAATANLKVKYARYYTNVQLLSGNVLPPAPWADNGGSGAVNSGDSLTIEDDSFSTPHYFSRAEALLDLENGTFLEFRGRVNSYESSAGLSPIREVTGVGVSIDDGTYQHAFHFADAGPSIGKIVFLATMPDLGENLLAIRAQEDAIVGTYVPVDWSIFHLYRFERTVGGRMKFFIDHAEKPVIDLDQFSFVPPPTQGPKEVRFGSLMADRKTVSEWGHLRHGISTGFDVSGYPVLTEQEVLQRFNQAINVIAEAGT